MYLVDFMAQFCYIFLWLAPPSIGKSSLPVEQQINIPLRVRYWTLFIGYKHSHLRHFVMVHINCCLLSIFLVLFCNQILVNKAMGLVSFGFCFVTFRTANFELRNTFYLKKGWNSFSRKCLFVRIFIIVLGKW